MADQTNPWGSAPSTDSASQAADAWGGASTAAPANGGGADWLHSALRRSRNSSISWIRSIRP